MPASNQQTTGTPSNGPADDQFTLTRVVRKLAEARNRLVDRNLRNRLISTPLDSTRTRSLKIVGAASDPIFQTMLGQKRSMTFLPIPELEVFESSKKT